jgi:tripartite-type tricarboxylate transporter receptor subunit TctC
MPALRRISGQPLSVRRCGKVIERNTPDLHNGENAMPVSATTAARAGARKALPGRSAWLRMATKLLAAGAACWAAAGGSVAQDFGSRPIRVIVGLPAGGATDATARLVGQKLGEKLNANVVIENRPGGNFIPAGREVMGAPPDGSTLYMISTSKLVTQPLYANYPLDLREFAAVTKVASGPLVLVARKDLPVKSLPELIAYAKQHPGTLKIGLGGGSGSSFHLALELLKSKVDLNVVSVPYRGAGPALNDLLGGHIDLMFDAMPVMAPQITAGAVTGLAVTGARRSEALPHVPTVMETGVPDFEVAGWFGLLAPPKTPPAIAKRIRDLVASAVAEPDVKAKLQAQGMIPVASKPDEWKRYLESELARWAKVIKEANIRPEQ